MSIQQVAWVLEHEHSTTGCERLVLLAIANHDGDGGSWPSVATLASEAGCSERRVQYALRALQEAGVIEIVKRGGGTQQTREDRRPNRYVIIHRRGADVCTPSVSRGARSDITGCKTGPHGVQTSAPEPSLEPSITKRSKPKPVENVARIPKRGSDICEDCHGSGFVIPDSPNVAPVAAPCHCQRKKAG